MEEQEKGFFTSNFVLDEMLTFLGRKSGSRYAAERAKQLYSSEILTILRPTKSDEIEAIELFQKYTDQGIGFTDCVSFVLMRRHKLSRVLTFDQDFALAGFRLWH